MADGGDPELDALRKARPPRRQVLRSMLRAVASVAVLVAVYYLLPFDRASTGLAVAMLSAGLVALIALVSIQVRSILVSPYPGLRAVEALATSVPMFLLLFAGSYAVMAKLSAADFGQPLTHTDALYFAVTVFATVGFGDIAAKTEAARLVVTGQMAADIVIIGLAFKVISGAVSRGQQRRADKAGPPPAGGLDAPGAPADPAQRSSSTCPGASSRK